MFLNSQRKQFSVVHETWVGGGGWGREGAYVQCRKAFNTSRLVQITLLVRHLIKLCSYSL